MLVVIVLACTVFLVSWLLLPLGRAYLMEPDLLKTYPHSWIYRIDHSDGFTVGLAMVGLVLALGMSLLH